ncbi:hypothetical protein GJ496_000124 [Pomphorhynchus laevis]|nr:hypothetical protein GJ496_000124 [Pomphorhynchus laevis]
MRISRCYFVCSRNLHYNVFIAGAGTAGLAASAALRRLLPSISIGIADGATYHYYQPSWSLAAVNLTSFVKNRKHLKSLIPKGVNWIQTNVKQFFPEDNYILLDNSEEVTYDYMLVTCGLEMNYESISGLEMALENDDSVFTIFDAKYHNKAYKAISSYTGNEAAIFTYPMNENFKCRGAAAKIMFLANDVFQANGIASSNCWFITPKDYIFSVARYNKPFETIANERSFKLLYGHDIKFMDCSRKELRVMDMKSNTEKVIKYGLMHVTPEMRCPKPIRSCSNLVDPSGFVNVNPQSLQHVKYKNIISFGDCSNVPTSKTAAAASEQLRTVVPNVIRLIKNDDTEAFPKYTGYTACPLLCGSSKLILAEFDFCKNPMETFPIDQRKPSRLMYLTKKYTMPWIYWNMLVRGHWYGPTVWRKYLNKFAFWKRDTSTTQLSDNN